MASLRTQLPRIGLIALTLLLVVTLALGGLAAYTIARPWPNYNGTVTIPGLRSPVEIRRDANAVPHIYADTTHDLFLAQGYVHAQDRFFQMDFWRHQTSGRLSEWFGASTLNTDKFLRTVGWARVAEQEYAQMAPDERAVLDAYAAGVNAYIANRAPADLGVEYSILGLLGAETAPEPWTGAHSLAWGKAMAWDLGGNLDAEVTRAELIQRIGAQKTTEYLDAAIPASHPVTLPDPALGALNWSATRRTLNAVTADIGGYFEGIGSNNWVIAGSRTTTGAPLLADDMHLSIQMPAIWYMVGLHCRTRTAECPYTVTGYSFAGVPGVVVGQTDRIAWGFTNVGPDVQDLYVEKVNWQANTYEYDGQNLPLAVLTETIHIRGGGQEVLTVRASQHGPLIEAVYGLTPTLDGQELGTNYALALRWTALEPIRVVNAILGINRAQNFTEFRTALRDFDAPSQNVVYADVDGNIGYQVPGNIPIRRQGDGRLPVPGWTDAYEWTGYIPFDELPYAYNPPQGYIATANNAVVDDTYPYLLGTDWDPGYRARRIVDMIEAQPKISPEYIAQMHGDNLNLGAADILPPLLELTFAETNLQRAQADLRAWDGQMHMPSRPAAVYTAFLRALIARATHDDIPAGYRLSGGSMTWVFMRSIVADPASPWWDDQTTPNQVETRTDIYQQAFREAYADVSARLGDTYEQWTWGDLHTATFRNQSLGRSGVAPVEALFNRGPFRASGGSGIVNATNYNFNNANPYEVTSLPSMRLIADLSNLNTTQFINTTGQSGHAFSPHYIDMAEKWRNIGYLPLWFGRADVERATIHTLTLQP